MPCCCVFPVLLLHYFNYPFFLSFFLLAEFVKLVKLKIISYAHIHFLFFFSVTDSHCSAMYILQDWIKRRKVEQEELENIEEQHQPSTSHSSLQPQTLRDVIFLPFFFLISPSNLNIYMPALILCI